MTSLSDVALLLGFTTGPTSFAQIARYLKFKPPISLLDAAERTLFVTSFDLDKPIRDKWAQLGWEGGSLGMLESETMTTPDGFMRYARFQYGSIYWTSLTGAIAVLEPIRTKYEALRTQTDDPKTDQYPYCPRWTPVSDTVRTYGGWGLCTRFCAYSLQDQPHLFGDYAIYWSQDTDAHWVGNEVLHLWETKLGGGNGILGFPTTDEAVQMKQVEHDPEYGPIWAQIRTSHFRNGAIEYQGDGPCRYNVYYPEGTLKYIYDFSLNPVGEPAPQEPSVKPGGSGNVPPPPATGVSSVILYNCHSERRTVHLWMYDLHEAGLGWQSLGPFLDQYDDWGYCPIDEPKVIDLKDSHIYEIVAVDPQAIGCEGSLDPTLLACRKWALYVMGNKNGMPWTDMIV